MKGKLTELVFILDESGSMHDLVDDTIGGFNSMIRKQKSVEGECLVSVVLFNQGQEVLYDRVLLPDIPMMTTNEYNPGGLTALLDALGGAIHHIGNVHKYARETDRPAHTLFIITTDGLENASCRYSAKRVRSMVERQKSRYGWEFLFLGANIDTVETARHYGIDESRAVRFHNDSKGIAINYDVIEEVVHHVRSGKRIDRSWKRRAEKDYEGRHKA